MPKSTNTGNSPANPPAAPAGNPAGEPAVQPGDANPSADPGAANPAAEPASGATPPSNEEVLKSISLQLGFEVTSMDELEKLKAKLKPKVEVKEPTEDELKAYYIKAGLGTEEDYNETKDLLSKDPDQLAKLTIVKGYKAQYGLDDTEAEELYRSRYFVDEDEEGFFSQKNKELGKKMRDLKAGQYKEILEKKLAKAKSGFTSEINAEANKAKVLEDYALSVETAMQELSKKISFKVGEKDQQKDVDFNLLPEDIAEIQKEMQDPGEVAKLFYNKNNHNLGNMAELLMWRKFHSKILSHSYNEGANDVSEKIVGVYSGAGNFNSMRRHLGGGDDKQKAAASHNTKVASTLLNGRRV